jgi:hypothetical protein
LTAALVQLDEAMRHSSATPRELIAAELDRLEELIGALPLTTDAYCFAVNWTAGAGACWSAGDCGAARFLLEMVRKKLAR